MSEKSYNNLDYLLKIYYEFIYSKKNRNKYFMKPIDKSNIKLIDLKKDENFDYEYIFDKDFEITFDGFQNDKLVFTRKGKNYNCNLSFGYFSSDSNDNMNTGVLYNMGMMYMVSDIIVNERFRHSIAPLMLFKIDYKDIKSYIPDFEKYQEKYQVNEKGKDMYCLITEKYFKMTTLDNFLFSNKKNISNSFFSVLLFQIIFYLYKMQQRFKDFRHNNLNLKAIKVYVKKPNDLNISYKINGNIYILPNLGFDIKVSDYEYSNTSDYIKNTKSNDDENSYFDLFTIINHIVNFFEKYNIDIPIETKKFMEEIVPIKYRLKKGELNIKIIPNFYEDMEKNKTIPIMILTKNKYFEKFIQNNIDSISPIEDHEKQIYSSITDKTDEPLLIARNI